MRSGLDKPLATLRSPLGVSLDALSAYAILGEYEPKTVADFAGVLNSGTEYYRVAGSATTFDDMFDYSDTASLRTMVDYDGALKWCPHNLLGYDRNFEDNSKWVDAAVGGGLVSVRTADAGTDPDGGTAADRVILDLDGNTTSGDISAIRQTAPLVIGGAYIFKIWAAAFDGVSSYTIQITDATGTGVNKTVTPSGGWLSVTNTATFTGNLNFQIRLRGGQGTSDVADLLLYGGHVYRSDLGGMVDNPDRADTLVPNDSGSPRYLARRNHYRYNGTSFVKKGISLESAASTNLLTQSNDFTTWSDTGGTVVVTSDATTGPDGQTSADELDQDGGYYKRLVNFSGSVSTQYTYSIFAKASTNATRVQLYVGGGGVGGADAGARFSLVDGSFIAIIGGGTLDSYGSEDWSDGWFRFYVTFTTSGADGVFDLVIQFSDDSNSRVGVHGYPYGVQLEVGSVPTSYTPTNGATVTRAAETLTIAGSDMAASTTAMSFHTQGELSYADLNAIGQIEIYDWSPDLNNQIALIIDTQSTNAGDWRLRQELGGTGWNSTADEYTSPGLNRSFNHASRHTDDLFNYAVDGTAATEDTSPTGLPDLSSATFELAPKGFTGAFSLFRQDDSDWTDTGIEEAST